jgi:hypothetical protein
MGAIANSEHLRLASGPISHLDRRVSWPWLSELPASPLASVQTQGLDEQLGLLELQLETVEQGHSWLAEQKPHSCQEGEHHQSPCQPGLADPVPFHRQAQLEQNLVVELSVLKPDLHLEHGQNSEHCR